MSTVFFSTCWASRVVAEPDRYRTSLTSKPCVSRDFMVLAVADAAGVSARAPPADMTDRAAQKATVRIPTNIFMVPLECLYHPDHPASALGQIECVVSVFPARWR